MKFQIVFIRLVIAFGGCLALCVVGTVSVARAGRHFSIFTLQERLLPGHPLPADTTCREPVTKNQSCTSYRVSVGGKEIYLAIDQSGQKIADTVYSAHEYTIGELILAWGLPSGFTQYGSAVQVYWDRRFAYLITCSFQPDSHVELISYSLTSSQAPPWRGFKTSRESRCADGIRNP